MPCSHRLPTYISEDAPNIFYEIGEDQLNKPFTINDVDAELKKLANGKASDSVHICAELLKGKGTGVAVPCSKARFLA